MVYLADGVSGLQIIDPLQDISGITQVDEANWRIDLSNMLPEGIYHGYIGPDIADLSGNVMDQNADGVGGQEIEDVYNFVFCVDTTSPQVPDNLAVIDDNGSSGDAITNDTTLTLA